MGRLYKNEEWLRSKYNDDGWSQTEIASFCGVSQSVIYKYMKQFNIKTRLGTESQAGSRNGAYLDTPFREYGYLYHAYVVERKTIRAIAEQSGVSLRTVARWLSGNNIKTRGIKEAALARDTFGSKNPNWKAACVCGICGGNKVASAKTCKECRKKLYLGKARIPSGLASLSAVIRSHLIASGWRDEVLRRDNYTCGECGDASGGNLEAHHIIPLATIRDMIVVENCNLDLDAESDYSSLVSKILVDSRINDLDNGTTLCSTCHRGEHARLTTIMENSLYTRSATIVSVTDGDTITLDIDLGFHVITRQVIKLYGINTPEISRKNSIEVGRGLAAKKLIERILEVGRKVQVRTYKPDSFGRWLGIIILDGVDLNDILCRYGIAEQYTDL